MKYLNIEQKSEEWFDYKVGKVSGTRFGQLISGRDNLLLFDVVNELLDGYIEPDDFESEDMIFGNENESVAIDKYEDLIGLKFARGGVIDSDFSPYHMASPDAVNVDAGIVVEIKCTRHGATQIKRHINGIDSKYLPQVINYFAVSDDVKEVHWVSYCPFRPERELVPIVFNLDTVIDTKKGKTIKDAVIAGRELLKTFESDILKIKESFLTYEF